MARAGEGKSKVAPSFFARYISCNVVRDYSIVYGLTVAARGSIPRTTCWHRGQYLGTGRFWEREVEVRPLRLFLSRELSVVAGTGSAAIN
jgi:hypothetical protein